MKDKNEKLQEDCNFIDSVTDRISESISEQTRILLEKKKEQAKLEIDEIKNNIEEAKSEFTSIITKMNLEYKNEDKRLSILEDNYLETLSNIEKANLKISSIDDELEQKLVEMKSEIKDVIKDDASIKKIIRKLYESNAKNKSEIKYLTHRVLGEPYDKDMPAKPYSVVDRLSIIEGHFAAIRKEIELINIGISDNTLRINNNDTKIATANLEIEIMKNKNVLLKLSRFTKTPGFKKIKMSIKGLFKSALQSLLVKFLLLLAGAIGVSPYFVEVVQKIIEELF
jgi:hypothetical protein